MRRRHSAREFTVAGRQSYGSGGDTGQQRRLGRGQQLEAGLGSFEGRADGGGGRDHSTRERVSGHRAVSAGECRTQPEQNDVKEEKVKSSASGCMHSLRS